VGGASLRNGKKRQAYRDTGWAHPTWPLFATLTSQRNKIYV